MEFEMVDGILQVHRRDPNKDTPKLPLIKGLVTSEDPSDINASQIGAVVAALLSALDQLLAANEQLMDEEKKIEGVLETYGGAIFNTPQTKELEKKMEKQLDALIERQKELQQSLRVLEGMAANIGAHGCAVTSTSNPLEALAQEATNTLKKSQEIEKDAKALLKEIGKVLSTLTNLTNTAIGQLQKEGDEVDTKLEQRLKDLLKAIEDEAKKMAQSIQQHLQTHPTPPLNTSIKSSSHSL
jgi:ElaB/YqjD/DUF883 family membrane-anchored ribosome-binding protein